jgi:hypothetical protein
MEEAAQEVMVRTDFLSCSSPVTANHRILRTYQAEVDTTPAAMAILEAMAAAAAATAAAVYVQPCLSTSYRDMLNVIALYL